MNDFTKRDNLTAVNPSLEQIGSTLHCIYTKDLSFTSSIYCINSRKTYLLQRWVNCCQIISLGKITEKLLMKGVGLKQVDKQLRDDALHLSAQKGYLPILQLLLRNRADINSRDKLSNTLLHVAVKYEHLVITNFLLDEGLAVDSAGESGCTPFLLAVKTGNVEFAQLLLAHGADLKATSSKGETALMLAAAGGHVPMVEYLLKLRVEVNATDNLEFTALMKAVENDHIEVARVLLHHHASVNTQNELGMTALILATLNQSTELVALLLECGTDIDLAEISGMTALMVAAELGYTDIVQLLLANGASIHTLCKAGHWALRYAAKSGNIGTINSIIHSERSLLSVREAATSVLSAAAESGHIDVAKHLLSLGADLNHSSEGKLPALLVAVKEGYLDLAELLIDRGADLTVTDENGRSLLMLAAQCNFIEIVHLLLDEGVEVDYVNENDGSTALHYATQAGHMDIIRALLTQGRAATQIKDKKGRIAQELASTEEIRSLFSVHGVIDDVLILVPCGEDRNRMDPAGKACIYSNRNEILSADEKGQLSWLEKKTPFSIPDSCIWTVQPAAATSHKFTLRSKYDLFLSHDIWGYAANRTKASTWEEFDVTQLPAFYPTFGVMVAFRLKLWTGHTLCRGAGAKAVVSRLIYDESFKNLADAELNELEKVQRQCARLFHHVEGIPERIKWIEEKNALHNQLQSAFQNGEFARVAELSEKLHAHCQISSQLSLSERHYYTLSTRQVNLLEQLDVLCRIFRAQKEYDHMNIAATLRLKLHELHVDAPDTPGCSIPTKKSTPVTSVEALLNNVDSWLFDDSGADECSEWLDKKDSLTTQLAQAEAGCDFMAISVLGKKLQAHTAAAAQLAVSEEKYYSLPTQRAQLLVELKRECFERIQAQNFDIVIHLSAALDAIQKTDDRYPPPVPTLPAAPADAPILCIIQEPAEAVTLSLLQVHKQAPAGDHTSPTSVVAVPSEDPTPWDPCCNTPPRMLVPPTESESDPVWVEPAEE